MCMIKEVWKDIPEYEGLYQVSNYGQVKSLERTIIRKNGRKQTIVERIIKLKKNKDGYLYVNLCKDGKQKTYKAHRLVASVYIQNINNLPQVNHKNEIKTDNRVENLEWVTPKENCNYGTHNEKLSKSLKGRKLTEEHKQKLSEANKKPILQYTKEGIFICEWDSATDIEKELNINQGHISECCNAKRKTCGGYVWKYKE